MSVVIHGIDMPKNCWSCPCWWEDSEYWCNSSCKAGSKYTESPNLLPGKPPDKRPDDCPLQDFDEVMMKHYKQGRIDEAAEREGRLMQSFSPD